MQLTESEKSYIRKIYKGETCQIFIRNKSYFIKSGKDNLFLKEKLGEHLAELIGLKHAIYDEFILDGKRIIITEDLNSRGEFLIAYEYFFNSCLMSIKDLRNLKDHISLNDIWAFFEESFYDSSTLMFEVIKMYLLDALLMNYDRNYFNWGIINENGELRICILDNTEMLEIELETNIHSYFDEKVYEKNYDKFGFNRFSNEILKYFSVTIDDLEHFLKISSSEFLDEFIRILSILTPAKIREEISEIENQYGRDMPSKDNVILCSYLIEYFTATIGDQNISRKI